MAPTGTPAPAGWPGQDEDREQRIAALRIRLHETAGQIGSAEDWTRYLRAAARLHGETWANVLLISSRIPDATLVRGYEAWRAAGRQVNRDEKGIEIFSGMRRQEPDSRGAEEAGQDHSWRDARRVAYVWDLSQTTGEPVPLPPAFPAPAGEAPPGLWDCLCWLARREGFAVEREDGSPGDGTAFWAARRIRIPPGLSSGQAAWALAHQLGHVLVHNTIAHPPGTTTSGCHGIQKAEADSVAFITCARHGIRVEHAFASPRTWAGTDPRAQPAAAILTAGERVTTAAAKVSRLLDHYLADNRLAARPAEPATTASDDERPPQPAASQVTAPLSAAAPDPRITGVLDDAMQFYDGQLARSWVPAYLAERGIGNATMRHWRIGYAPGGWTALTGHLRALSHSDDAIQAAGLARLSSRGTLIDHFRDRVMLPVHDERGNIAGFLGRARPGAGPQVPKYLNSPETSSYHKGSLLFGLHQARDLLARGATPVIVEGPFDAIAVTVADPGHHAGLAPCGTALTSKQAAILAQAADLGSTGVLVAFDDDPAGRKAAVRAHGILRTVSSRLQSAVLSGKDPAEILQTEGPAALRAVLRDQVQPLSAVVIDAHLALWERRLHDPEGPLLAMRSTATVIAGLLPAGRAEAIRQITGNRELATVDEQMRPVANPELPEIARVLPADTAYQTMRVAERLGFTDYSDVLAEVANAVTRDAARPGNPAAHRAPQLAAGSFPHPPAAIRHGDEHAIPRPPSHGNRLRQAHGSTRLS
jgi:DNA primase catalytic core